MRIMSIIGSLWILVLQGCYSFSATSLPPHIKTVRITDVKNQTSDPALGIRLQQGIIDLFRKDASGITILTDDNSEAHAEFSIVLIRYENRPDNYSRDATVETYKTTIAVQVMFQDKVKNQVIYQNQDLRADGLYDVLKNETEEDHGQRRAIEKLQELIVTNALARW